MIIMFLIFLLASIPVMPMPIARSQQEIILKGRVTTGSTDKPLVGATVHILGAAIISEWRSVRYDSYLTTNDTGYYSASLYRGHYRITVILDDPETPGLDYVPGFLQLDLSELSPSQSNIVADFHIFPGTSVLLSGTPEFVELGGAPEIFYTTIDY